MKAKTIKFSLNIPAEYRYIATNPWGETIAFKGRPTIGDDHWDIEPNEISLTPEALLVFNIPDDWRNSIREI